MRHRSLRSLGIRQFSGTIGKKNGKWFLPADTVVEHMTTLDKIPFILGIANFKKGIRATAIDWCNNQLQRAGIPPIYAEDVPSGLLPNPIPNQGSAYKGVNVYSQNNFKLYSNNLGLIGHKMSLPVILRVRLPKDTFILSDEHYIPHTNDVSILERAETWQNYGSCAISTEDSWHADDIIQFKYLNFQFQYNKDQQAVFLKTAHLARLENALFIPKNFPPLMDEQAELCKLMEGHRLWSSWLDFEEDEIECVLEDVLDTDVLLQFWDGVSFDASMSYSDQYFRQLVPDEVAKRCSEAMICRKAGHNDNYKRTMKEAWRNYLQYT